MTSPSDTPPAAGLRCGHCGELIALHPVKLTASITCTLYGASPARDGAGTRRFPIQGEYSKAKRRRIPETTIPWEVAERAYATYAALFPSSAASQSLDRLAERGGFGRSECAWLLAGGGRDCPDTDPGDVTLPGEAPHV